MKKLILLFTFITAVGVQAQFSLTTHDDEPIENNQTFSYNTTAEDVAKLGYIVHNDTDATIIMKAEIEEITGSDGSDFEICFGGSCYFQVTQGQVIPQSPVAIPAGGVQGMFDHMWNKNTSNSIITYKIKFYMIDGLQNPTGEPFYVNYVYNENLTTVDLNESVAIKVVNTLVKDKLVVDVNADATIAIFSTNGKLIQKEKINSGISELNIPNLKSGNYIINIKTIDGNWLSKKILVK